MIDAARRDAAYRQIVIAGDGGDDVTAALTANVQLAMDVGIAHHGVELGRGAAFGLEDTLQRRTGAAEDRIADIIRDDGDAACL